VAPHHDDAAVGCVPYRKAHDREEFSSAGARTRQIRQHISAIDRAELTVVLAKG
jgi:hypothetical protein